MMTPAASSSPVGPPPEKKAKPTNAVAIRATSTRTRWNKEPFAEAQEEENDSSSTSSRVFLTTDAVRHSCKPSAIILNELTRVWNDDKQRIRKYLSDQKKELMARFWWENHLQQKKKNYGYGWHKFTGGVGTHDYGFIPGEFKELLGIRTKPQMIQKGGVEGTHYAIGWLSLFDMVLTYGTFEWCNKNDKAPTLLDYDVTPLPGIAMMMETSSEKKKNDDDQNNGDSTPPLPTVTDGDKAATMTHTVSPTTFALETQNRTLLLHKKETSSSKRKTSEASLLLVVGGDEEDPDCEFRQHQDGDVVATTAALTASSRKSNPTRTPRRRKAKAAKFEKAETQKTKKKACGDGYKGDANHGLNSNGNGTTTRIHTTDRRISDTVNRATPPPGATAPQSEFSRQVESLLKQAMEPLRTEISSLQATVCSLAAENTSLKDKIKELLLEKQNNDDDQHAKKSSRNETITTADDDDDENETSRIRSVRLQARTIMEGKDAEIAFLKSEKAQMERQLSFLKKMRSAAPLVVVSPPAGLPPVATAGTRTAATT